MRKHVVIAAVVGASLSVASLTVPANAMTNSAPAGLASAVAGTNAVEKVWCSWRGCWGAPYYGAYWGPRPYWGGYYGYYGPGPLPYYGWRRRWF